jgi:hypothetical protein
MRVVAPVAVNQLVLSLIVNSYWLWLAKYFGGTYPATVAARAVQTALLIPVQVVVVPMLLRIARPLRKQGLLT